MMMEGSGQAGGSQASGWGAAQQCCDPPAMLDLCNLADGAALLRIDYLTLWRWVRRNSMPSIRFGGQYLLDRRTLLAPFNRVPMLPKDG